MQQMSPRENTSGGELETWRWGPWGRSERSRRPPLAQNEMRIKQVSSTPEAAPDDGNANEGGSVHVTVDTCVRLFACSDVGFVTRLPPPPPTPSSPPAVGIDVSRLEVDQWEMFILHSVVR